MGRVRSALASGVPLQLVGLVLLVAWGYVTWGLSGALFVGAVELLFLGFVVAQPAEPSLPVTPEPDLEQLWTF